MKFSPDSLLQIYLDGSFTEEAQTEFDQLIRKDPVFAERVTQAVAERVGPVPEASLSIIESKLDAQMASVWEQYKPSLFRQTLKWAGNVAAVGIGLAVLYLGGTHLWTAYHGNLMPGTNEVQDATGHEQNGSFSNGSPAAVRSSLSSKSSLSVVRTHKASASVSRSVPASVTSSHGIGTSDLSAKLAPSSNSTDSSGVGIDRSVPAINNAPKSSSAVRMAQPGSSDQGQIAPPPLTRSSTAPSVGNGTQEGDALKVSIETQKTESVVVNVLDSHGLLVRRLYQGPWEAGNHQVDWDGKDDLGNPVLPGDYTVTVNAEGKTMSGVVTVQPNK